MRAFTLSKIKTLVCVFTYKQFLRLLSKNTNIRRLVHVRLVCTKKHLGTRTTDRRRVVRLKPS